MGSGNSGAMIPETTLNFKAEEMMVWGKQKKTETAWGCPGWLLNL